MFVGRKENERNKKVLFVGFCREIVRNVLQRNLISVSKRHRQRNATNGEKFVVLALFVRLFVLYGSAAFESEEYLFKKGVSIFKLA